MIVKTTRAQYAEQIAEIIKEEKGKPLAHIKDVLTKEMNRENEPIEHKLIWWNESQKALKELGKGQPENQAATMF